MALSVDPQAETAYKEIRSNSGTKWVVLGYSDNKTLQVLGKGSGDFDEAAVHFKEDDVNYAYFRCDYTEDETNRTKFALISWKGDSAPVMKKGKMSVHIAEVKKVFKEFSVELSFSDKSDATQANVLKRIKAANY
jgi:hypothetical protein